MRRHYLHSNFQMFLFFSIDAIYSVFSVCHFSVVYSAYNALMQLNERLNNDHVIHLI